MKGAKIITLDPRLSNTASKSDVWLPTWPGSEAWVLLAIAKYLIDNHRYDRAFVERWVNWEDTLRHADEIIDDADLLRRIEAAGEALTFDLFHELLQVLYADFTFERAAQESQVPIERIKQAAEYISHRRTASWPHIPGVLRRLAIWVAGRSPVLCSS